MQAPISRRDSNNKLIVTGPPTIVTASADDNNCRHFVMASCEPHDEEDSLSHSTGAYSIKLSSSTPLAENELNVVKNTSNTLDHVSIRISTSR